MEAAGFQQELDVSNPQDRAVLRLFCLGNVSDAEQAKIYHEAFTTATDHSTRELLIAGLNRCGRLGDPAVQPTYLPAMFTRALANSGSLSKEQKINILAAILKYLAQILQVSEKEREKLPKDVTVIERDVRSLEKVVASSDFRRNPEILNEKFKVEELMPEASVANVA